jgi:hypothetical protein
VASTTGNSDTIYVNEFKWRWIQMKMIILLTLELTVKLGLIHVPWKSMKSYMIVHHKHAQYCRWKNIILFYFGKTLFYFILVDEKTLFLVFFLVSTLFLVEYNKNSIIIFRYILCGFNIFGRTSVILLSRLRLLHLSFGIL